jgi:hypothetical protein
MILKATTRVALLVLWLGLTATLFLVLDLYT